MSIFAHWSRDLRKRLRESGVKASHSQVNELLARGLGHRTYRSFAAQDLSCVESVEYAIVSSSDVVMRAEEIGIPLSRDASDDALFHLQEFPEGGPKPWLVRVEHFDYVVRNHAFPSYPHPAFESFASGLPGSVESAMAYLADAEGDLDQERGWRWHVRGSAMIVQHGDDYEVPFTATLHFPKAGRRLLWSPALDNLLQAGPPQYWDGGEQYGPVSDSDD